MFDRHCTACDRTQLIFPSQVQGVTNTDHGILVSYVCWCGSEQTWLTGVLRPGRAAGPRRRLTGTSDGFGRPLHLRYPRRVARTRRAPARPTSGQRAALAQSVERFTRNE